VSEWRDKWGNMREGISAAWTLEVSPLLPYNCRAPPMCPQLDELIENQK